MGSFQIRVKREKFQKLFGSTNSIEGSIERLLEPNENLYSNPRGNEQNELNPNNKKLI